MSSGMISIDTVAALSAAGDLAAKGTVVLAAAWIATMALRRASASARHLAWTIGFGGLLALPVLAIALPSWQIPILPAEPVSPASLDVAAPGGPAIVENAVESADPAPSAPAPAEARRPGAETARGIDFSGPLGGIALLAWVTGAALALLRLASSITRVRREARGARVLTTGPAAELRDRLVWRLGIDRPVVLLESGIDSMPLTWGIRRPRVLLPPGTEAWPADRLAAVLTHELAHVRRRDCAWQLVAEAACALHWFNPLAWAAAQRLRLESEHACDDQVLLTGSAGAEYAAHLLDVARTLRPPRPAVLVAVPMARPSQLRTRLLAVLSAERARGPVSARLAVPALLGATFVVAAIAALTPARAGAAEPFAVAPGVCSRPGNGTYDEDVDHDGVRTVAWRTGSCSGAARMEGDVRFTDDFTAVRSISPGGVFRLALRDGGRQTEVVIRPGADGGIHPTIRAGGRELPWGEDAERWLAAALPQLMRRTTYAADRRARTILSQQGMDAALREMGEIQSETVRAKYADALLGDTPGAASMRGTLDRLATAERPGAIPDLLARIAPRVPADAEAHAAYLRAAARIDRSAEMRRVLVALAESGPMGRGAWLELFRLAGRIRNGGDMEMLLRGIAPRLPADGAVHEAYLDAAGRIQSSADRRGVLTALVATRRLDAAMQVRVLGFVEGLGNGTEREMMLTHAAPHLSRDPRVARAYRAAAEHVANADERRRALAAYDRPEAPRDTIPRDRLDDPEATTILSVEDRHDGAAATRVLLAKNVVLTADRSGIERILPGGWLVFREEAADGARRVRIEPGPGGRLRYRWDGSFREGGTDAWLRRMTDRFLRATYPNRRW